MACQGTMEARLETEEPASVEATPELADDQEVPVEDAEVRSVAEPRKRRRDGRNLAAVRRQNTQNPRPGREASRETTGFGRCPQRNDPSCGGCATQSVTHKGDSGILPIPEASDRRL
jgi:hypothetical protein